MKPEQKHFENEIWKPVVGYEDKYEVSNKGRVRSLPYKRTSFNGRVMCEFTVTPKVLNPYRTGRGQGYPTVCLLRKNHKVHRLVARAFIPNPDNLPEVNHIDGDKSNNCVENLEWVTTLENSIHSHKNGLKPTGERVPGSKLTAEQVKEIRATYRPGVRGFGAKSLARKFGVSDAQIRRILSGKKWRYENGN